MISYHVNYVWMKPIQINIDEPMLKEIDQHLKGRRRARAEFIRQAVHEQLKRLRIKAFEEQERRSYEAHPVKPDEFVFYRRKNWPPT